MKSFSILRTNVGLTSNVKIMVDSKYNLFLESIDSSQELVDPKFKKMQFNKNNYFDELVPFFFRKFPLDLAFKISNFDDANSMSQDFGNQYDDMYQMGARNIINNKNYSEEFEYFAPLYIFKHSIPKYFIIFRLDGPGLINLNKNNFREEFLNKFKTVKIFDMTKSTELGEWIENNFKINEFFPNKSLEIDFRKLEFSVWWGIDYESGGYTYKSKFMDNIFKMENTLFDFEKSIFDGYKTNKLIHPQILNFSFLFDDTPATPQDLRPWSLNRYSGFYFDDMELIECVNPYVLEELKPNVQILKGNELYHPSGDPFIEGFKDNIEMWIEYDGDFYKVEKYTQNIPNVLSSNDSKNPIIEFTSVNTIKQEEVKIEDIKTITITKYRIISEFDLEGKESFLNIKSFFIENNILYKSDGTLYQITGFEEADIHLMELNGHYHNLILENGAIKIISDYAFEYKKNFGITSYINSRDPLYLKFYDLKITNSNKPRCIKIFRLKFTDIKDFDTLIVDNEFSRFEYEKQEALTLTEEPKLYSINSSVVSLTPTINTYYLVGENISIPVSSDYTSNLETFRISRDNLTELWRKNSTHCRFAYQNSLSNSDYPYLLNNSFIHEPFNRSVNSYKVNPERSQRNLDYFYTLNSGKTSHLHHTLHIEKNFASVQESAFRFELDKYLNLNTYSITGYSPTYSSDYFSYFFNCEQTFLNGTITKKVRKFSQFDAGDNATPNITVFRGLKFKIYEVSSIKLGDTGITNLNLSNSNMFNDYKFSILTSQNLQEVNNSGQLVDIMPWDYFTNYQFKDRYFNLKTIDSGTPSKVKLNDVVELRQFYPIANIELNTNVNVNKIGSIPMSGYGFSHNTIGTSLQKYSTFDKTYTAPGYYKVNHQWKILKNWQLNTSFNKGDLVIYDDIIFEAINNNSPKDIDNPYGMTQSYKYADLKQPFWTPNPKIFYFDSDWCYRQGEFYIKKNSSGIDFWTRDTTYNKNDVVIWDEKYYLSLNNVNFGNLPTTSTENWKVIPPPQDWEIYAKEYQNLNKIEKWERVKLWSLSENYKKDQFVVYNEILYRASFDITLGEEPGISIKWQRIHTFSLMDGSVPKKDSIYNINGFLYLCTFSNGNPLNNGITIYINKKWKNILVNININDNTMPNIENVERDLLYTDTNTRLTAYNFMIQFNNLNSRYFFNNYTTYVVIEEDGTSKKYNYLNNLEKLPYIIECDPPDGFEIYKNSLVYSSITISDLKPNKFLLQNNNLESLSQINFYNGMPYGYEIRLKDEERSPNFSDFTSTNIETGLLSEKASTNTDFSSTFYRHRGLYMPLFYDIILFKAIEEFDTQYGNYKFDENLHNFGIVRQRIISKVNRKENILKLKNSQNLKSIYPMLDEFGYTVKDFFLFKSTWDYSYYFECEISET